MSYDYSKLSKKQIDESILLLKSNLEDAIKYYTEQKEKVHIDTSLLQVLIQDIIRGKYKFPNELLKIMDLSLIDFSDINITGVDFRDTNANIDPQTVKYKSLDHTNLSGLDMSDKCFDGCSIMYANLSNTSANIDPQTIDEKSLYGANLENLDLSFKCFDDVCIANTNLEGTNANIDPQTIKKKILTGANLYGLDMRDKCFDDCDIREAILIDTGANITIYNNEHYKRYVDGALLYGCDVTDYRKKLTNFIRSLRKK